MNEISFTHFYSFYLLYISIGGQPTRVSTTVYDDFTLLRGEVDSTVGLGEVERLLYVAYELGIVNAGEGLAAIIFLRGI
jgi:hypothetical protein